MHLRKHSAFDHVIPNGPFVRRRKQLSEIVMGKHKQKAAQVDQWLDFCTNEIDPNVMAWLGPIFGFLAFDAAVNKQAIESLKVAFTALNRYLEKHTFLVGERLTLADIAVASTLVPVYQKVLEPRLRQPYVCMNRCALLVAYRVYILTAFLFHFLVGGETLCGNSKQAEVTVSPSIFLSLG